MNTEETDACRFLEVIHVKTYENKLIEGTFKYIDTTMVLDLAEVAFYEQYIDVDTEQITDLTLVYSKSGLLFKILMPYENFKKLHTDFFNTDTFWFPDKRPNSN